MKKLFLGLAMTTGALAFAQEQVKQVEVVQVVKVVNEKPPIRFGIKAGGNAASFSEQELSLNNQKIGFHAGVFVNIPLSQKFSLQPEVLYNQLGARSVISSTDVTTGSTNVKTKDEYKSTLNYISVPLMVQMRATENFYIEAGPEFSYFLDGKTSGDRTITTTTGGTTVTQTQSHSEDINKDNINKFNVGLGLGLGYDFTHNLGINARYVNSLTDIAKDRPDGQNTVNNRVFQLGLNYKF
ncbi:opacity protein-like surface antigen [Chryseobacterium sp. H1D6B]|uniref:porin family protein n=1 Tax=Chryseobacterium sp. H1D6B TaxID=2940588 RepID=UPI0015C8C5AD|nr:porin family protein [Chryseobacterium sp. H1D6B]MDH6253729.1 opacity protein-like surface antigen [Chryseobacterium sp. H1D6B]